MPWDSHASSIEDAHQVDKGPLEEDQIDAWGGARTVPKGS